MADNILDRFKEGIIKNKEIDSSKKLKIGIIGTGWISEAHISNYLKMPDCEIVAAADLIPGKAEALFEKHGIKTHAFIPMTVR